MAHRHVVNEREMHTYIHIVYTIVKLQLQTAPCMDILFCIYFKLNQSMIIFDTLRHENPKNNPRLPPTDATIDTISNMSSSLLVSTEPVSKTTVILAVEGSSSIMGFRLKGISILWFAKRWNWIVRVWIKRRNPHHRSEMSVTLFAHGILHSVVSAESTLPMTWWSKWHDMQALSLASVHGGRPRARVRKSDCNREQTEEGRQP